MDDRSVALITDSTCDIPRDMVAQYDITVVPLHVVWGQDTFRDGVDMEPQEFYRRLAEDRKYPSTAHPTPDGFLSRYREALRHGADRVVVLTLSSALSGAFEAAQQAATMADAPVHVFDSRGTTMSLGWQVIAAARARERGGDAEAMIQAADEVRQRVALYVTLDTLEYLHKGGRIGGAARLVGSLLDLKPLVYVDHESGKVDTLGRVRTRRRGLNMLYERFFDQMDTGQPMHIAVMHGDAPKEAGRMAERIRRGHSPAELLIDITGPVLGVHTGPGAIALCGYSEDRRQR